MADDRNLCAQCIEEGPLRDWLVETGVDGDCGFADGHISVPCVTVDAFAEQADHWFQENFQPGSLTIDVDQDPNSDRVYHGTEGLPYDEIFASELGATDPILRAVLDALPDVSHRDIAQGAEAFYTDAHNFESIKAAEAREKADRTNTGSRRGFLHAGPVLLPLFRRQGEAGQSIRSPGRVRRRPR